MYDENPSFPLPSVVKDIDGKEVTEVEFYWLNGVTVSNLVTRRGEVWKRNRVSGQSVVQDNWRRERGLTDEER